ncbi:MAG: HAD hydrolase family protein, partial [Coprobacillus sp.]
YENTLQKEDLHALLNYLEKHPAPCGFTLEDDKIFNYRDERVDEVHSITLNDDHPAGDCSQIPYQKIYQCMCFISQDEEDTLLKLMPHSISARWHPLFCDISPIGGTKQNGIDKFLEHYQIDLKETMAFGDGGNDIPMLKHVATSVAMGNANEEVKAISDYITDTVENDGIAKALKEFDLI